MAVNRGDWRTLGDVRDIWKMWKLLLPCVNPVWCNASGNVKGFLLLIIDIKHTMDFPMIAKSNLHLS